MKKTHFFYILSIVFSISFLFIFGIKLMNKSTPYSILSSAFKSSGAAAVSAEMYFRGQIDEKMYTGIEGLKELAENLSRDLKIQGGESASSTLQENDMMAEVKLDGIMEDGRDISVRIRTFPKPGGGEDRHVFVTVTHDGSEFDLEKTGKEVLAALDKSRIDAGVTSCITGAFSGRLKKDEMNEICKMVFKEADAKKVEGIKDGNLISVSAYSSSMGDYIQAGNNRINLNIALRYNSYEDKTYIWLAAPVILTEY
jgi:hypothetical protein